jgi:ATP-dependent RNA helicase DHX36
VARIAPFLSRALDPPEPSAVHNAVQHLRALGALNDAEVLTPLGSHLAVLPMEPAIGRLLLMGALFDCLAPVLSIAASLTYRSPFVVPLERRAEADRARACLAGLSASDHWALLNAHSEYARLQRSAGRGSVARWCREHFVVQDTMELIGSLRQQLAKVRRQPLLAAC